MVKKQANNTFPAAKKGQISEDDDGTVSEEKEEEEQETIVRIEKTMNKTYKIHVQTKALSEQFTRLNPEGKRHIAYIQSNEAAPRYKKVALGKVTSVLVARNHEELVKTVRNGCPKVKFLEKRRKKTKGADKHVVVNLKDTKSLYSLRNRGPKEVQNVLIRAQILVSEDKEEAVLIVGVMELLGNVMKQLRLVDRTRTTGTVRCLCFGSGICNVNVVMMARLDDKVEMRKLFEKHAEVSRELNAVMIEKKDANMKKMLFGEPDNTEGGHKVKFDKHDVRLEIRVYGRQPDSEEVQEFNTMHAGLGFKAFYARTIEDVRSKWPDLDLTRLPVVCGCNNDLVFTIRVRIHYDSLDIISECQQHLWGDVPSHYNTPIEYAAAVLQASALRELQHAK